MNLFPSKFTTTFSFNWPGSTERSALCNELLAGRQLIGYLLD